MTTRVTISTHDWPVALAVTQVEVDPRGSRIVTTSRTIGPNSIVDEYIHSTRTISVTELELPANDPAA